MSTSEYLTPEEVGAILKVSPKTVVRRFQQCEGVIDHGSPETKYKRRYRVLRIPRAVLNMYIHQKRVR